MGVGTKGSQNQRTAAEGEKRGYIVPNAILLPLGISMGVCFQMNES